MGNECGPCKTKEVLASDLDDQITPARKEEKPKKRLRSGRTRENDEEFEGEVSREKVEEKPKKRLRSARPRETTEEIEKEEVEENGEEQIEKPVEEQPGEEQQEQPGEEQQEQPGEEQQEQPGEEQQEQQVEEQQAEKVEDPVENILKKIIEKKPGISADPINEQDFNNYLDKIPNFNRIMNAKSRALNDIKNRVNNTNLIEIPLTEFRNDEGKKYIYAGTVDSDGNLKGYGKLYLIDANSYYEGGFLGNYFNGKGLLISGKGDNYLGEWKNGEAFGAGEIEFNSGAKFKGNFKNSFKEGQGVEENENGDTYQGNYYQNERNGSGFYRFKEKQGKYQGIYQGKFEKGLMHDKQGAFQWADGRIYNGNISNGEIEGHGAMQYSDGSIFKGNFKDQKKQGRGIYQWNNGDCLYGYWNDNKLEGKAILDLNNKKYDIFYKNDVPTNIAESNADAESFHTAKEE